jgi:hypothetical protein
MLHQIQKKDESLDDDKPKRVRIVPPIDSEKQQPF